MLFQKNVINMNNYFATFISGFSDVIVERLKLFDPDIQIIKLLDGLVVFKTVKSIEVVKNLRFFSNIYQLVDMSTGQNNVAKYISYLTSNCSITKDSIFIPKKNKFFRITVSSMGILIGVDKQLTQLLEDKIAKAFSIKVDRALPDSEFWIFEREGGVYLFGHRVTYHQDYKDSLQKGELRPDLSNLLCYLSEPNREDVFMDPFSGSESIIKARIKIIGYKKIISGDIKFVKDKRLDALNLSSIGESTVSKIVTDPPWGINVGKNLDLNSFYKRMLVEFYRVLIQGGILVILIGDKKLFDKVLVDFDDKYGLSKYYDILVNGKKARVYKLIKK